MVRNYFDSLMLETLRSYILCDIKVDTFFEDKIVHTLVFVLNFDHILQGDSTVTQTTLLFMMGASMIG